MYWTIQLASQYVNIHAWFIISSIPDPLVQPSPTESVHSEHSACRSAYSGQSASVYSGHSGSSTGSHYVADTTLQPSGPHSNPFVQASPTGSIRSERSVPRSVHSGYSNYSAQSAASHSGHSGSNAGAYGVDHPISSHSNTFVQASPTSSIRSEGGVSRGYGDYSGQSVTASGSGASGQTTLHPAYPAYVQQYTARSEHSGATAGVQQGPPAPRPPPQQQHYYRLGTDGYQGILAPEVLEEHMQASPPWTSSQISSPRSQASPTVFSVAGSSAISTPATVQSHLPSPSVQPPPPHDDELYLRLQLGLPRDRPVDLWALEDPPDRGRPNQSYPNLTKLAIFGSPKKKLTLQEIYKALIDRFEWFKDNEDELAWKVKFPLSTMQLTPLIAA